MPSEQALPFSEAAREAAARTFPYWLVSDPREQRRRADGIIAAAVNADPRAKAFLKLAALSDEELVERVAVALRVEGAALAPMRHYRRQARVVLAALGLPVAEETTG